jgi:hypothetical protein
MVFPNEPVPPVIKTRFGFSRFTSAIIVSLNLSIYIAEQSGTAIFEISGDLPSPNCR